jgi:anti-sigma B factor antagonist
MEIHERPCDVPGVRLLALDGGLDQTNTEAFVARMDEVLQAGPTRVVLDLERLTYISSWGLAALVRAHHRFCVRGGRLAFANLHGAVAAVLKVSRLDRLFDLYRTVEEAVRGVAGGPAGASGKP